MNKKAAYLVLGPESCGNRLATRLLIAAGCIGDGRSGPQRLDTWEPQRRGVSPIVWLRSIPHNRQWPNIGEMVQQLSELDYQVRAVVPTRDWAAVIASQVHAGHCRSPGEAWSNLQKAYPLIFQSLSEQGVPFVVLSYESLVQRPRQVVCALLEMLDLPLPDNFEEIVDGNAKWLQ